jgi:hypothetical protein
VKELELAVKEVLLDKRSTIVGKGYNVKHPDSLEQAIDWFVTFYEDVEIRLQKSKLDKKSENEVD